MTRPENDSTPVPHRTDGAGGCFSPAVMPGPAIAILADQREALRMLAGSPLGTTESIMIAHGFGIGTLHDSVRNGGRDRRGGTVRVGGG